MVGAAPLRVLMFLVVCLRNGIVSAETDLPTGFPSATPSSVPSAAPSTDAETALPTGFPTVTPSSVPSAAPSTDAETALPTGFPSATPSSIMPSAAPSIESSAEPTVAPTAAPSTDAETALPTGFPTVTPSSIMPTVAPSIESSAEPTVAPTAAPSTDGTAVPTAVPSTSPTADVADTDAPSAMPTAAIHTQAVIPGETTVDNVDSASFDEDYEAAFISAFEKSLNLESGGGATVSITDLSAPSGRRKLLDTTTVGYAVTVMLEEFGVTVDTVFDTVDTILTTAQQSLRLTDDMNAFLTDSKGEGVAVLVESLDNQEENMVITYVSTAAPTAAPLCGEGGCADDDNETTVVAVVVVVSLLFASLVVYCCFCRNRAAAKNYYAPPSEGKNFEIEFPMSDNSGSNASECDRSDSPLRTDKPVSSSNVNLLDL